MRKWKLIKLGWSFAGEKRGGEKKINQSIITPQLRLIRIALNMHALFSHLGGKKNILWFQKQEAFYFNIIDPFLPFLQQKKPPSPAPTPPKKNRIAHLFFYFRLKKILD